MIYKIITTALKNIKYYNLKGMDDVKAVIQTAMDMSGANLTEADKTYINNAIWNKIASWNMEEK